MKMFDTRFFVILFLIAMAALFYRRFQGNREVPRPGPMPVIVTPAQNEPSSVQAVQPPVQQPKESTTPGVAPSPAPAPLDATSQPQPNRPEKDNQGVKMVQIAMDQVSGPFQNSIRSEEEAKAQMQKLEECIKGAGPEPAKMACRFWARQLAEKFESLKPQFENLNGVSP